MTKKWNDFTRREKVIGVFVALFAVVAIGGMASGNTSQTETQPIEPTLNQSVTTYDEIVETETIPYEKTTVEDASRADGTNEITTAGVNGERTLTYRITLVDGVETARELTKTEVTKGSITEATTIGTYVEPETAPVQNSNCDPNYSGACVPIASDVDCGGGSGNGPEYLYGTAYVVGSDIYGLDRDNDGIACE